MQDRRDPKIDVDISPQGGRGAMIISVIALLFSAVSLYETLIRQPHLVVTTASTWLYARGEETVAEELSIPLTVTNSGAREATVLSIELTLEKGAQRKVFQSVFLAGGGQDGRILLPPMAIGGRSSFSGILIFTPADSGAPLVDTAGDYTARLRIQATFVRSYGWLDGLTRSPAETAQFALKLSDFPVADVIGRRKAVAVQAKSASGAGN